MLSYDFWVKPEFTEDLLNCIDTKKPLMFDTETIGLYGRIRLAQFYQDHFKAPILIEYPDVAKLVSVLNNCHVVGHNISYDVSTIQDALGKSAWQPPNFDDTFYLSRLKYYDKDKFTLDACIYYALGHNPYLNLDESKKELQKAGWGVSVLSDNQKEYSSLDVYYLWDLWEEVKSFKETPSYKLDIKTLKNNFLFQCNGLPVDADKVNKRLKDNAKEIESLDLSINCNSYQQVRKYINSDQSDDLGLARLSALGNVRAVQVRKTRKLTKENSFLKKFLTDDGHIYGKFSPSARSGRSTCRDQNLQQLPKSTKECFGVPEGGDQVLIYSDFSQLELRCICSVTGDKNMEALFREGKDLHTYTAQDLFHTEKPTNEQRYIAKTCNFGLLYGASSGMFSQMLLKATGILMSREEAVRVCVKWKSLWKAIADWQQLGLLAWQNNKTWQTPLGRKYTANRMTDQLNIQIQGMGSEVAKFANWKMNSLFKETSKTKGGKWLEWSKWQRNFIHDSYIFVVPNDEIIYKEVSAIIANSMQHAWLSMSAACKIKDLPMPVEVFVGYNWDEIEQNKLVIYKHTK